MNPKFLILFRSTKNRATNKSSPKLCVEGLELIFDDSPSSKKKKKKRNREDRHFKYRVRFIFPTLIVRWIQLSAFPRRAFARLTVVEIYEILRVGVRWRFRARRLRHRMSCHGSTAIRIRAPPLTNTYRRLFALLRTRERWYSRTRIPFRNRGG